MSPLATGTRRLWWYAVIDSGSSIPDLVGVDGISPVFLLPGDHVDLVVSDVESDVLVAATGGQVDERTAGLAVEHDRVVGVIARNCPAVLPVRFGSMVDPASAERLGDATGNRLASALESVRNKVEYGIRVVRRPKPPERTDEASSGAAYLAGVSRRRQAALQQESAVSQRVAVLGSALGRLSDASTTLATRRPGQVVNEAYLVAVERADEFVAVAEAAAADLAAAGADLVLTGPWAPYSFAAVSGSAAQ